MREDEASKLLADSIVPIDSYDPTRPQNGRPDPVKAAAKRLYIRLPSRSCPQYAKVINLLGIFDGNMPVILYREDTKQKLAAPGICTLPGIRSSLKNWKDWWAQRTLQQNDISVHESR